MRDMTRKRSKSVYVFEALHLTDARLATVSRIISQVSAAANQIGMAPGAR
jgi:hypothetical protein